MGENVAAWLSITSDKIAYWPGGTAGAQYQLAAQDSDTLKRFDNAELFLFNSLCAVHDYYRPEMVKYWQDKGFHVVAHPECQASTVAASDSHGSTAFISKLIKTDAAGTHKYAIATERHLVDNLREYGKQVGIEVVNVGDAKIEHYQGAGCGCATMSRNDPPHLAGLLDLLRQGKSMDYNRVEAGDVVNEFSGSRQRLNHEGQDWVRENARLALTRMIEITQK
jgi:quinolinate synthase